VRTIGLKGRTSEVKDKRGLRALALRCSCPLNFCGAASRKFGPMVKAADSRSRDPRILSPTEFESVARQSIFPLYNGAFRCLREGSKTGSKCSPKLEVPQDFAFEKNVVYGVNFQTVYLSIELIFPIRCSSHFSFIRLSPIVLYPRKSDAV